MLSHENISSNAITSIAEIDDFETGPEGEVVISFLPLTHVFARMLQYAYMMRGISIYFAHPDDLVDALPKVRPTVFASVPRVLEKVYAGIKKKVMGMQGLQKRIGEWGLQVAQDYDMTRSQPPLYALKRAAADRLVFRSGELPLGAG
jgi:Long-chain acyl-CoA synthetases (AMP-forming)